MSGLTMQTGILDAKDLYEQRHRIAFACEHVAGLKVLELACGLGTASSVLASIAAHVTAVDADGAAIDQAQALYGNIGAVTFQAAALGQLPFEDQKFDAVLSFVNLAQFGRRGALLEEIRRVLKPEGFALITLDATGGADINAWEAALAKRFSNVAAYAQRMVTGSSLAPLDRKRTAPNGADYRGYRTTLHGANASKTGPGVVRFNQPANIVYLISNAPLPHVDGPDSIFLMEALDLWTKEHQNNSDAPSVGSLSEELRQASIQIAALLETRDSLERILLGQAEGLRRASAPDLSIIGPMMAEIAGAEVPADVSDLVKLLGQVSANNARQEMGLAAAQQNILALTTAKRNLVSELEGIATDAEMQSVLLRDAAAVNDEVLAKFAQQIRQQTDLVAELLGDLDRAAEREVEAAKHNQNLATKAADLEAHLAQSRMVASDFSIERQALSDEILKFDRSLKSAHAANEAVEELLVEATTARDAAEHRRLATLSSLQEAVSREQDFQAALARCADIEGRLNETLAKMKHDLSLAQDATVRQTNEIQQMEDAKRQADARFEAAQQALAEKLLRVSQLEAAGREAARRLDAANHTVDILNARLAQAVDAESRLLLQRDELEVEKSLQRQAWDDERLQWAADQTQMYLERDALERERQTLLAERDASKAERSQLNDALEVAKAQGMIREADLRGLLRERQAWNAERETYLAEREQWAQERSLLTTAAVEASERADVYEESLRAARWWTRIGRFSKK